LGERQPGADSLGAQFARILAFHHNTRPSDDSGGILKKLPPVCFTPNDFPPDAVWQFLIFTQRHEDTKKPQ
jgi:hypothetical protein